MSNIYGVEIATDNLLIPFFFIHSTNKNYLKVPECYSKSAYLHACKKSIF